MRFKTDWGTFDAQGLSLGRADLERYAARCNREAQAAWAADVPFVMPSADNLASEPKTNVFDIHYD